MMARRYMVNLNWQEIPPLSEEEVVEYIKKAQAGDQLARDQLIEANLKLVRSVVQRFAPWGYEKDDLFQIGCIGLVKAIDNFNIDYGVKLSTYAVPMIIGEIRRFLRDDNPIRVSRSLKEKAYQIRRATETLTQQMGRDPTIRDLADEVNMDMAEVALALESIQQPASLSEPIYQKEGAPILLSDQLAQDEKEQEWLNLVLLKSTIKKLHKREQHLIFQRFFQDKTQAEVAKTLGLSQVQVSRLEKQILKRMKNMLASDRGDD